MFISRTLDNIIGSTLRSIARIIPNRVLERRFTILIYHRVLAEKDSLLNAEPDAETFNWQMELLAQYFRPVPLFQALQELAEGEVYPGTVCVTFDDGYADNFEVALPILKRWNVPATFFIATNYLEPGRMWNDTVIETVRRFEGSEVDLSDLGFGVEKLSTIVHRRALIRKVLSSLKYMPLTDRSSAAELLGERVTDLPNNLMMSAQQVQQLSTAGMEVGAHTVNHPILSRLTEKESKCEILESVNQLETLIGRRPRFFAYPNGRPEEDYTTRDRQLVESIGLKAAVSTHHGAIDSRADIFQLPRFTPWDKKPERFAARLALNNIQGSSAPPNLQQI